jgi:hypothetical protein
MVTPGLVVPRRTWRLSLLKNELKAKSYCNPATYPGHASRPKHSAGHEIEGFPFVAEHEPHAKATGHDGSRPRPPRPGVLGGTFSDGAWR